MEFSTAFDRSLISVTVEHCPFPTFDPGPLLADQAPRCVMYDVPSAAWLVMQKL